MAKTRKSMFEWLTGGGEADTFDEIESGGTAYPLRQSPAPVASAAIAEEEEAGELSVDVYQTPTHIVIKAMIAGVRPDDLDVSITRDTVTIRGKRERHTEGTSGDYFFQELYWGAFARTIVLPQEVDMEGAEAQEKHGLLIIKLPKLDKGRQAKLKIRSN